MHLFLREQVLSVKEGSDDNFRNSIIIIIMIIIIIIDVIIIIIIIDKHQIRQWLFAVIVAVSSREGNAPKSYVLAKVT